eukprot:6831108-Prymnesium_polylepis.1
MKRTTWHTFVSCQHFSFKRPRSRARGLGHVPRPSIPTGPLTLIRYLEGQVPPERLVRDGTTPRSHLRNVGGRVLYLQQVLIDYIDISRLPSSPVFRPSRLPSS